MPSPRRRQKSPQDRVHDPERTRSALLDAAQREFADHGMAGARVEAIAARAGVNKQLISYYFGGKQGLYDAVAGRRQALVDSFDGPDVPLPELARRYVQAFADHPDLERIFLREVLDQDPDTIERTPEAGEVAEVLDLRRRQQEGELAATLDPAFVLLLLQAMTLCGAVLPAEAKRLTGLDPRGAEFRRRLAEQVGRVAAKLA